MMRIPIGAAEDRAGMPTDRVSKMKKTPRNQNTVDAIAVGVGIVILTVKPLG